MQSMKLTISPTDGRVALLASRARVLTTVGDVEIGDACNAFARFVLQQCRVQLDVE